MLAFFRLLLIIPWAIVGVVYAIAWMIASLVAWLSVVILGRYPEWAYRWNSGFTRYHGRVGGWFYFFTDDWPPFGWAEDPAYPVRVPIAPRPEAQSRLKAFFRLILVLPLAFVQFGLNYLLNGAGIAAWLTIVFRGYYPEGLQRATAFVLRWNVRFFAYESLMTDVYPPVGDDAPKLPEALANA